MPITPNSSVPRSPPPLFRSTRGSPQVPWDALRPARQGEPDWKEREDLDECRLRPPLPRNVALPALRLKVFETPWCPANGVCPLQSRGNNRGSFGTRPADLTGVDRQGWTRRRNGVPSPRGSDLGTSRQASGTLSLSPLPRPVLQQKDKRTDLSSKNVWFGFLRFPQTRK